MANKGTDFEAGADPRDITPGTGTDDRVEQVRGTADDETEGFDETEDDEEMDEDEEDEGTF